MAKLKTHAYCDICKQDRPFVLVSWAEKLYNPVTNDCYYNDHEVYEIRCDECYSTINDIRPDNQFSQKQLDAILIKLDNCY